jgi:chromate reductase
MNILVLVGSLRADSWTARLAATAADLLPEGTRATAYADLAALPHYDQDLDGDTPPAAVAAFREAVASADALLVATPEYNGSLPGVLKNAVDWASRPRGASSIAGKPVAVVSVSPSPRGAQWAREDAEKVLRVAGALPLERSLSVPTVHETLVDGEVVDADLRAALAGLMAELVGVPAAA